MEREEAAGREERQRDQQHPGVETPARRATRGGGEREADEARAQEQHEVDAVVVPVRIEPRAEQQRAEAYHWEGRR
jgi:hypothetical protein